MKPGKLFWGLILILFGGLLLLDNLGLLAGINFSIWAIFWPTLLILLGVWVLAGDKLGGMEVENLKIPLDGAREAHLRIRHGAGRMAISAGAADSILLEGEFRGGAKRSVSRSGDRLGLDLQPGTASFFPFTPGMGRGLEWIMRLGKITPLFLEINCGANENQWDLSELNVKELHLSTGASTTQIRLPASAGNTRVKIESGAATLDIKVPEDVAARIRSSSGLATVTVDQTRFPRTAGGFESPDYLIAQNKIEIELEAGLATIQIS